MEKHTVKSLAKANNIPVAKLIDQFVEAGMPLKQADDVVSDEEKMQLIQFRRQGKQTERIKLKRKTVSQLRPPHKSTNTGTVNVEVRKKRTYVKRKAVLDEKIKKDREKKEAESKVAVADPEVVKEAALQQAQHEDKLPSPGEEAVSQQARYQDKPSSPEEAATATDKKTDAETTETRDSAETAVAAVSEERKVEEDSRKSPTPKVLHIKSDRRGKRKPAGKRTLLRKVVPTHKQEFEKPTEPVKREVEVFENMAVKNLAQKMAIKSAELVKQIMDLGMVVTLNQTLDQDTAALIVEELGHIAKPVKSEVVEKDLLPDREAGTKIKPRPPVVTVMGHVDHGKTSLLDFIRKAAVAEDESGGITQHIGAYRVNSDKGAITFLDTPGHAAFTSMRARGAKITDIVVLVVAADDGVMPQTVEAIRHSRAADVPIVVAINKIDKQNADVEKIKGDIAKHDIVPEDWGGDNIFVEVSAKTGQGIENLLEAILLQAEVMELKAPEDGMASGVVIESALDKGRGPVVTVLVQAGTLVKNDILLAGTEYGKVRGLFDERGNHLTQVKPSESALVLGLSGVPNAGEEFIVTSSERKAKEVCEFRRTKVREAGYPGKVISAESFLEKAPEEAVTTLNILLKADVQGSIEALRGALEGLSHEKVKVRIISSGIGGITESDVHLASAANAFIIGFNVRADARARKSLQTMNNFPVRYYNVIYEAIDDVKQLMSDMLVPEIKEQIIGIAEVKDVFRASGYGSVAGCRVMEGMVRRGSPIRVLRNNVVIYEGKLESLRRFRDETEQVSAGTECGIAVKNYNDVKVGDSIEVYERVEVQLSL